MIGTGGGSAGTEIPMKHLLNMDPPEHGAYRNLVNRAFTHGGLDLLEQRVESLSTAIVDSVVARLVDNATQRGDIEFVTDLAAKLPLAVICEMLGVPEPDWDDVFNWTNEIIGSADPEYQAGRSAGETAGAATQAAFMYFSQLLAERRAEPREDLTSLLAASEIDGEPLADMEILSYAFLLMLGGNETTRNATSGGMLALLENPEQLARLNADPALLPNAVEEIVRWTSPIIHFARYVEVDTEICGQKIEAGQDVVLWYPSANRDEEIFSDPDVFDIARAPNEHLAFGGYGEHFCLGANLARLELQVLFREIFGRLDNFELAGDVERLRSGFVGGIKHLPVSYTVTTKVLSRTSAS